MNLFGRLIPGWAIAVGAAIVGALIAAGAQQMRVSALKAEHAKYKAEQAALWRKQADMTAEAHKLALKADRAATQREQTLTATIESNAKEAKNAQTRIAADRDRALTSERSLRKQLDTIAKRYRALGAAGADSPAAGQQPTAGNAFDLLTKLLGESDERSGILADFADHAHAAGLACERDYDAARAALIDQQPLGLKGALP